MTKKIILISISILVCCISRADLYDLYDLDQLRNTLPAYIQTIIARYTLSSINTSFMLQLRKKSTWALTTTIKRERSLTNFLEQGIPALKAYKKPVQRTFEETFYLEKNKNFPHRIIVSYQDKNKPLVYKYQDTISYPEGTVINFYWLDRDTREIHVIIDNEEHIWQAYVKVGDKEYTWESSVNLENYLPHKMITLEQVLFLMLINFTYTKIGNVDFAYLAYTYQHDLGKRLPVNSVQAIIDYLYTILESFGPDIEPLITRCFFITNSSLHTQEDYEIFFNTKKKNKLCVSQ